MENIIKAAVERGASDLHIKAGDVFRARIDGKLQPLTKQRLTPEQTKAIALKLIPTEADRKLIDQMRDYDCSWGAPGIGRFRVNILRQRSSFMIVMRVIPFEVPSIEKLRLPRVLEKIAEAERGMILVTGVTGSGKSSTMAAIVNQINASVNKHIVTLENPIEFLHRDLNCSVTQREIGVDTDSFASGLRAALRQDPDVVLIGELRDAETIDTAMKAAETGHLLISTLHTPDATSTVSRIVAMFPAEEQEVARIRLADSLQAVISQRLLPRADGKGRAAALEVMLVTSTIRDLIRDRNRVGEIRDYIAEGKDQYGMQTFDQSLMDLYRRGLVTYEEALRHSTSPDDFALVLRGVSGGGRSDGWQQEQVVRQNVGAVAAAKVGRATPAPVIQAPKQGGQAGHDGPPGFEIERFSKAESLVRYFGLDPVHGSSGDKHWDGHRISKTGVSYLRGLLAQGCWSRVTFCPESDIAQNYERLVCRGKTKQQALMMVARRLVKCVYWMLKEQREFTINGPARSTRCRTTSSARGAALTCVEREAPAAVRRIQPRAGTLEGCRE